jgi:hypothetical protein
MNEWTYEIFINGEKVDETDLRGIAYMKFESAKLVGLAELHRVYNGENYDPVIHFTTVERGGIFPPCPQNTGKCSYRKSVKNDFHSTTRPTAFRTETMCPGDRCGFLLMPSKIGGDFFDYGYCIAN